MVCPLNNNCIGYNDNKVICHQSRKWHKCIHYKKSVMSNRDINYFNDIPYVHGIGKTI